MSEDVVKVLDLVPLWKRLRELPGEVDDLRRRLAELEAALGGKYPPDACRYCGERAARLAATLGPQNKKIREHWTCQSCGRIDVRFV